MSDELKPCPFCGGKPKIHKKELDERFAYANEVTVQCSSCGCSRSAVGDTSKPGYADNSSTEKRAIEKWNRRTADTSVAPVSSPIGEDIADINLPGIDTDEFESLLYEFAAEAACDSHFGDDGSVARVKQAIIAYIDGRTAGVVPDGWKLVPVDPTQDMIDAAEAIGEVFRTGEEWDAMIAAAPTPRKSEET
jgi:Lar family restriction alleviation protein